MEDARESLHRHRSARAICFDVRDALSVEAAETSYVALCQSALAPQVIHEITKRSGDRRGHRAIRLPEIVPKSRCYNQADLGL